MMVFETAKKVHNQYMHFLLSEGAARQKKANLHHRRIVCREGKE